MLATGCLGGGSKSPTTYTVSGQVTDANGEGVANVTIVASSSATATTDVDGKWTLTGLKNAVTLTPFKEAEEENAEWVFQPKSIDVAEAKENVNFTAHLVVTHGLGEEVEIDNTSGVVNYQGGISLDLAAVPVPEGTTVKVEPVDTKEVPDLEEELKVAGPVLSIEFSDPELDFSNGVTLTFPVNEEANEDNLGIFHHTSQGWMYEPSTIENGQIKATVKSFSLYGVFEATKLVPPTTYKEQGIVSKGETIELAHTQGAEIYYGADPTLWPEGFSLYEEPFTMTDDVLTFYAVAVAPGKINSEFVKFEFQTPEYALKDSIDLAKKTVKGVSELSELPIEVLPHIEILGTFFEDLETEIDLETPTNHLANTLMPFMAGLFLEEPNHHYVMNYWFEIEGEPTPIEGEEGYATWIVTMPLDNEEVINLTFKTDQLELLSEILFEIQAITEGDFFPLSGPQGDLNFFFESEYSGSYGAYTVDGYISVLGPTIDSTDLILDITDLWIYASIKVDGYETVLDGHLRPEFMDEFPFIAGLSFDGRIDLGDVEFVGSLEIGDVEVLEIEPFILPKALRIDGYLDILGLFKVSVGQIDVEVDVVEKPVDPWSPDETYAAIEIKTISVKNAGYHAPQHGIEIAINSLQFDLSKVATNKEKAIFELDTKINIGKYNLELATSGDAIVELDEDEIIKGANVNLSDLSLAQFGYPTISGKASMKVDVPYNRAPVVDSKFDLVTDEGIKIDFVVKSEHYSVISTGNLTTLDGEKLGTISYNSDPDAQYDDYAVIIDYIDGVKDRIVLIPELP